MTTKAPMTNVQNRPTVFNGRWRLVICWSLALGHWSFVQADSIFVGTLERPNATIKDLKGDILVFDFNGRTIEQQASKVTKVVVPTEPILTAAEDAYVNSRWDVAVDNYLKAQRSSKQWVKDWASMRLIDAAGKSGRFDAAASAYIAMLLKNPAGAGTLKPTMPNSRSTFLDTAAAEINTTLKDPKLSTEQRRALLGFLIEIQQARKDQSAEDAAFEQLSKLPGADVNDPNAKRVLGRRKLINAARALESKNYPQVLSEIESGKSFFVDFTQQADGLYLLAEAQAGAAGNDATRQKDAALAYMRVVALAKNAPDRPHVVDSLIKTAVILERLGEAPAATQLYAQIIAQYPDDPLTASAKQSLARLKQI